MRSGHEPVEKLYIGAAGGNPLARSGTGGHPNSYYMNIDRPGVIGMVGKVLGDNSINIVRMQCALEKRGGNALLIIGSDTAFPASVLEQIKSSSNILSVKVANLS